MVAKGGKVLVFRKDPTPAEVAAATSDPYEDWDPAPLAEPVPGGADRPECPRDPATRDHAGRAS